MTQTRSGATLAVKPLHRQPGVLAYDSARARIQCAICGRWLQKIEVRHLALHGLTIAEYKELCGLSVTTPLEVPRIGEVRRRRNAEQGRGVAELRETSLSSANMAVKMAEKRACVDAVLRAAGLSQYFTQDMEDMLLLPPSGDASETATGADSGARVRLCTERQRQAIRVLLGRAGQTEDWLLAKLHLERLDNLPYARAEQVIRRLGELARERGNAQP
jgi:hypothetical protein